MRVSQLEGAGPYTVFYVDPPWPYDDKMSGHPFSLDHEYETQDMDWIRALPVEQMAAKDATLFLWVTSPLLPEAMSTIDAWGFKFKTVAFVWNKLYYNSMRDVHAPGRWTMGNTEQVWLAVRGKPKRVAKNVHQLVTAHRTKRHSEKPHEVRERIVTLMGDVPRIELFARHHFAGWDVWGNEAPNEQGDGSVGLWHD